jgi:hypothetical protein
MHVLNEILPSSAAVVASRVDLGIAE